MPFMIYLQSILIIVFISIKLSKTFVTFPLMLMTHSKQTLCNTTQRTIIDDHWRNYYSSCIKWIPRLESHSPPYYNHISNILTFSSQKGSVIKSLPNNDLANIFARVFRKLPQRVIWRHNSDQPENLSNNTKLLKWLPQNDLLGK